VGGVDSMTTETKTEVHRFLQEMAQEILQEMLQLVVLCGRNLHWFL